MASSIIHICVAKEINKTLNKNQSKLLLGSIAPDLSKIVGENKIKSHFLDKNDNIPNIGKFILKYNDSLSDDFVLGYYIHLYTDYLWFKNFIPKVRENIPEDKNSEFNKTVYEDYDHLNIQLIDEYNLDLSMLYQNCLETIHTIEEIPVNKLKLLIDKTRIIIDNSSNSSTSIINLEDTKNFIESSSKIILEEIKKLTNC